MKSGIATSLHGLARVDRERGLLAPSVDKLRESLAIHDELQDRHALADVLESIGGTLIDSGSPQIGAKALGLAGSIRKDIDTPRSPIHDRIVRQDLEALYSELSRESAEILMEQGANLTLEDLLAEVPGSGG